MFSVFAEINNMNEEFLLRSNIDSGRVVKRFTWASKRRAKRPEDEALCTWPLRYQYNTSLW